MVRAALVTLAFALAACAPGLGVVVTPSPGATSPCAPAPTFASPTDASYPVDLLATQQRMIAGGVDTDRVDPAEAALEYFARTGIADGGNTNEFEAHYTATSAVVTICRNDGSVVEALMFQPFPSEPRPIWAVRTYRIGR